MNSSQGAAPVTDEPRYQTKADVAPILVEFLNDLQLDDVVTELVQNDLDQGATATRITFGKDRLVAEGDGAPVDEAGWQRLSYVQGAGGEVPAKTGGIGIKNHGLRACFLVGDDIAVRSAGKRTQLTLRRDGAGTEFAPGAWHRPAEDSGAPATGCRIEVPFRISRLQVAIGDGVELDPYLAETIEKLFRDTCEAAARRFVGCVRPRLKSTYVLELVHWRLGTHRFSFSARSLPSTGKRLMYRRRCRVQSPEGKETHIEDAYLFAASNPLPPTRTVPEFFRSGGHVMLEIAWSVNAAGRPLRSEGAFRYPIGYSEPGPSGRTGVGVHFSAPFLSDTTRHGIAAAEHTGNLDLVEECESAVVRILADHLVPRFGPAALEILLNAERASSPRLKRLVLEAARAGALPAAPSASRSGKLKRFPKVPAAAHDDLNFIIPAVTWDTSGVSKQMGELAPSQYPQLHPQTPSAVVEILLAPVYDGSTGLAYTSFDEHDLVARLQPESEGFFPWASDAHWKRELSDPRKVAEYLDVLRTAISRDALHDGEVQALNENGRLPDRAAEPVEWHRLLRAGGAVESIAGANLPPIVHPVLAKHGLLTRGRLRLQRFDLDEFLCELDFGDRSVGERGEFFDWLIRNQKTLKGGTVKALSEEPVWRTISGDHVSFSALCLPDAELRVILSGYLHEPTKAIVDFRGVRTDGRGLLRLSTTPDSTALRSWYNARTAGIEKGNRLAKGELRTYMEFEADLDRLFARPELEPSLEWLGSDHLGLSRNGALARVVDLNLETAAAQACSLRPDDLARAGAPQFYGILGAHAQPAAEAILSALTSDPANSRALYPRLASFLASPTRDDGHDSRIRSIPFLSVDDAFFPPEGLALKSAQDFWGDWKTAFDASGLSPDRQTNLRQVGVTGRTPTADSSHQFFVWLSEQGEPTVRSHLDQVIRHFSHPQGPLAWWSDRSNVPCLPVYRKGNRVQLLTHRQAFRGSPGPLLPDFRELEQLILDRDPRRRIVIVETEALRGSILSDLRKEGLRTIRQAVSPPIAVEGDGPADPPARMRELLDQLGSSRLRRDLQKRLQELNLPAEALKTQWNHEVQNIKSVRLANSVWARFSCGSFEYRLRVGSGIDPTSGVLWIWAGSDPETALFGAVADRVFEPGSPRHYADALKRAVAMEYASRFKSPHDVNAGAEDVSVEADINERGSTAPSVDVRTAHPPPRPDPRANQPAPEPFKSSELVGDKTSPEGRKARGKGSAPRSQSAVERAATRKLKLKHYASHCQACLGELEPAVLAPEGSYAHRLRNRLQFVHAHHVVPVHAEGRRSVTNVVMLCKYHHDQLGDQLEPENVRSALTDSPAPTTLVFPGIGGAAPKELVGHVATVPLDKVPWKIQLFFTPEHARIWLDTSKGGTSGES